MRRKPKGPETFVMDGAQIPYTTPETFKAHFERFAGRRTTGATADVLSIYIADHTNRVYVNVAGMYREQYYIGPVIYIHPRHLSEIIALCLTAASVTYTARGLEWYANKARQPRGSVIIKKRPGQAPTVETTPSFSEITPRIHR